MADIKITPTSLQGKVSAKISPDQLIIQQASVKNTPPSLSDSARSIILRGEVQAQNSDGSTQIKTQRGTVTVRLEAPLPKGQKVDIQLSSGTPPRDAIVQTTPTRAQAQTPAPAPQLTQQPNNSPQVNQAQTQAQAQVQAQTQAQAQVQAQTQTTSQPTQGTQTGNIEDVKNLQTTARQASENIANTVKHSIDPSAIIKTDAPPIQTRVLTTGQAVRLTLLPPSLQNPTALAQFQSAQTGQPTFGQTLSNISPPVSSNTLSFRTLTSAQVTPLANNKTPLIFSNSTLTPALITKGQSNLPHIAGQASLTLHSGTSLAKPAVLTTQSPTPITDARIVSIIPPSTNQAFTSLKIGQIAAQSTGAITPSGNPVLQIQTNPINGLVITNPPSPTPQGTPRLFALNYPASNLPKGTQIILQPTPNITNAPIITPPPSWPILEDALELLLSQLSPSQGQSLLNTIPRPASAGFQFTAAAMIFIAATRGGDIAGWLGGRADSMLKASGDKGNLAMRLLRDIGTNTGRAPGPDAPPSIQNAPDWRGHTLPLLFGMEITKMNLWTKPFGDEDADTNAQANKGLRFIVDLDLSRMGNVQLDGLIQPYAKKLDLALRTEQEFGHDARTHIQQLWHRALTQIDMHGALDFQTA